MTSQSNPTPSQTEEIDVGRLTAMLWAGKWLIALCVAVAVFLGAYVYMGAERIYQADSLLQLEERSGRLALPEGLDQLAGDDPRTVTEVEILTSRMILGQVVGELNLDWSIEALRAPLIGDVMARYDLPLPDTKVLQPYARKGETLTLSFLQVPPTWLGASLTLVSQGGDAFDLTLPNGQVLTGAVGQQLSDPTSGFTIELASLNAPAGRVFGIRQRTEADAISRLRSNLSVAEKGRGSGILLLRFKWPDRPAAQRILNAVADVYVRQNIDRSAAEADSSLTFINEQLPQARDNVRAAETALNTYRQAQKSIDIDFETQSLLTQTTAIEGDLLSLQAKEDEIADRYTRNHPVYVQLLAERARLQARLDDLRAQTDTLPETQREVVNLTRNQQLAQQIYTQLLTRAQEVKVLRASTIGNVRVLDSALVGAAPVQPRRNTILGLAIVLGLLAGIGIILAQAWLRRGIQSGEEIENAGIPVFATVNYSAKQARSGRLNDRSSILALTDPDDLSTEALRSLRTSLHFGMLDSKTKSIAILSAAPGAGKSFTATNLAVISAQAGQRVCLVDADMRRGQLRKYFNQRKNGEGLADYLTGAVDLDAVLHQTEIENVSFIQTGRYPPNPAELLMRSTFETLVETLDEQFDLTIFDCPPVLAVTDPAIIGRKVGTNLMVAQYGVTTMAELQAAKRTLEAVGAPITGVLLNSFDARRAGQGGSAYSYRYDYKTLRD